MAKCTQKLVTQDKNRDHEKWRTLLEKALAQPEDPTIMLTLRRTFNSAARPVFARGIDKQEYVIKGQQADRQIINDQIVARLGQLSTCGRTEDRRN